MITCLILSAKIQSGVFKESSEPMADSRANPSFSLEYLYWKTQEDQLYPAILTDQTVANGVNTNHISLVNQKFEYRSGFRLGLGYNFDYENYDTHLAWTRIHPNTTTNISSSDSTILIAIPFFDQTNSDVPKAGSVVSQWQLNYDMLDLELGHKYTIFDRFSLRPNIGLKAGWINQLQVMDINNVSLGQPEVEKVQGSEERLNNFNGIGPRIGIDLHYGLGSQFGVFGTLSGALLYGNFKLKTTTYLADSLTNNGIAGNGPQVVSLNNSDNRLSSTTQILVGGDWMRKVYQKYWVRLGVAYEAQLWWNQIRSDNSIPQLLFVNTPAGGDLMMHGLTLQASITC